MSGRKVVMLVGLIVALGAAAWSLIPFTAGTHHCGAAAVAALQKAPAQAFVPGTKIETGQSARARAEIVACKPVATQRVVTTGVVAGLAGLGVLVAMAVLASEERELAGADY